MLLWLAAALPAHSETQHVVVLYDERLTLPGLSVLDASLVRALTSGSPSTLEIYQEVMDLSRFGSNAYLLELRDHLRDKYRGRRVDAAVAVMGPALDFLLIHGHEVFPGTPIVFCGIDRRELGSGALPPHVTGVLIAREFAPTLELALRLHPETRQVVLVGGTSEFDARLVEQARGEFRAYEDRVAFTYLTALPLQELLREVSQLPPRTVVLFSTLFRDGAGEAHVPHDVVERVSATANAPVYGFVDQYLGRGIVGGRLYTLDAHAEEAAKLTLEVLAGTDPAALPLVASGNPETVFDARQLERWEVSERQLPSGSVVRFRNPSLWDEYRVQILGVLALIALQTLLIIALLLRIRERRVERALHETEDRYRNVVESQSDLICRFRPDGTLTFVNEAYCRYFGRSQDDLVGTNFVDLLPDADRESAMAFVQSLVAAPRTEAYTNRVLRRDGTVAWQHWIDHAIVGADGRVSELQGVGRDITALRLAETEAQERREQVTHLTRVAILGELSGALAHELNQPLTAILSNAQAAELLLARGDFDREELLEILKDIVADDKRAGEVIRRLRELLKRGKADFQPLDVNLLVGEVLLLARGQVVAHHVKLASRLGADIPPSCGDRVQLQQVLLNLLINACEAMDATEPAERTLAVSTSVRNGFVSVTVVDSGSGLAPHVADRLFEPFLTTKAKGLGLGLSICRSIVGVHGGHLSGTNNSERGATFELRLPVYEPSTLSSVQHR